MPIRALIFDFDGLILDTETPEYVAWRELYREYGHEMPMDLWADCIGRPHGYFDPYAHLSQLSGQPLDREMLRQKRRSRTRELLLKNDAMPGVRQYLASAKTLDLKIAIASSSTSQWVDEHLLRLGLREYFDCLLCAEHTTAHKPDPAPYLAALHALGAKPEEAIALEDSPNGITAAKSAGIFTVAVPNPITQQLNLSAADLLIPSLENIALPNLLALAARSPARL